MANEKIVYMSVKDIKPYPHNPRHNDGSVDLVANSIRSFGFRQPIVVDSKNIIIAGHTRLKAAKKLGMQDVPVIVAKDLTEEQVKAYRLADNKAGESSEWNEVWLADELGEIFDFDMSEFGFGDVSTGSVEDGLTEASEDSFDEEADVNWHGVARGDVWRCGEHRLMCGDSTSDADVKVLMEGNLAELVFTDPPWNVAYEGHPTKKQRTIINDSMTTEDFKEFMGAAFECMRSAMKGGGIAYIVMSSQEWGNLMLALKEKGMHWSSTIIWSKDTLVRSRKDYHPQYEPIWYGWEGSEPRVHKVKDRKQSDVWQIARPKKSDEHPTMKPVELVARAINNSSDRGNIVLDPFGGSGTTMIASEQTGRRCFMMEIDPHYCDVILSRWEKMTGMTAERCVHGS